MQHSILDIKSCTTAAVKMALKRNVNHKHPINVFEKIHSSAEAPLKQVQIVFFDYCEKELIVAYSEQKCNN